MPDQVAEDTAAAGSVQESHAEETATTSAETQTTETGHDEGTATVAHQIPYSRFKQVNDKLRDSKLRIAELEEAVAAKSAATPVVLDLPEPPEGLTEKQRVAWYIQKVGRKAVEDEIGMPLSELKNLLKVVPETSRASNEQKWKDACAERGLDPKDERVLEMTVGFVKGNGMELDTAMDRVQSILKSTKAGVAPKQRMENSGVNGSMTVEKLLTWDKDSATEAAKAGKRSQHLTIEQIIAEKKKRAAASR